MSKKEFNKLKRLVELNTGNENQCRDALIPFAQKLLGNNKLVLNRAEWTSNRGRIDLIIIAEPIETDFGSKLLATDKIAIVYELKAPNKHLFEFHSSKRFIPTKDLSLAETQLFDYTQRSLQDMLYFSQTFGATDVRPGGIIIGREQTMFKITAQQTNKFQDTHELDTLKKSTINARNKFLYHKTNLSVYSWDHVLNLVK